MAKVIHDHSNLTEACWVSYIWNLKTKMLPRSSLLLFYANLHIPVYGPIKQISTTFLYFCEVCTSEIYLLQQSSFLLTFCWLCTCLLFAIYFAIAVVSQCYVVFKSTSKLTLSLCLFLSFKNRMRRNYFTLK